MKKESKCMDIFRSNVKRISAVLFFVLIAVVIISMATDSAKTVLPAAVILMLLCIVCIHMWQDSIVEIVIKDDIVELEFFDKTKRTIYRNAVAAVKETSAGPVLILRDESELQVMTHPVKAVIYNEGNVSNGLRQADFPDARFIKKK